MFSLIPFRRTPVTFGDGTRLAPNVFRDDFDRVFDRFFQGWPRLVENFNAGWGLDVQEKDDAVTVRAEAPGFEVEDFDINITGNQLTIQAVRKAEVGGEKEEKQEWTQAEYLRSLTLPADVDSEKAEAKYRSGILTITLPKSEQAKGRKIAVKA